MEDFSDSSKQTNKQTNTPWVTCPYLKFLPWAAEICWTFHNLNWTRQSNKNPMKSKDNSSQVWNLNCRSLPQETGHFHSHHRSWEIQVNSSLLGHQYEVWHPLIWHAFLLLPALSNYNACLLQMAEDTWGRWCPLQFLYYQCKLWKAL